MSDSAVQGEGAILAPAARRTAEAVQAPRPADWAMMLTVALIGGSAFAGIAVAVRTASPPVVACGRLWIGFAVMAAYAAVVRQPLPRSREGWGYAAAVGLLGYAAPFTIYPLAQQTVTSVVAGVYMTLLPLITLVLAGLFAGEAVSRRKLAGVGLGLLGVLALLGPNALRGVASEHVGAQLLCLLAVCGYASANVTMRRAPPAPPAGFAAAFLLCGAVFATPGALLAGWEGVSAQSLAAIVALGLFPTGFTAVLILQTVRRAGAGFFALSAYAAPLVALGLGVTFLGETALPRHLVGLALILSGLAVAGTGRLKAQRRR